MKNCFTLNDYKTAGKIIEHPVTRRLCLPDGSGIERSSPSQTLKEAIDEYHSKKETLFMDMDVDESEMFEIGCWEPVEPVFFGEDSDNKMTEEQAHVAKIHKAIEQLATEIGPLKKKFDGIEP